MIATLAERARTADPPVPVVIVTGDRDAFQLIDPDGVVRVMATARGITETKIYDHDAVIERYGIPPELIPDFYGLKGDTSDNIPGVPGIGDKTAAQLLQRFGTLEEVLAHVDDISGAKRQQNLREYADDARVSKVLATMQRDVAGIDLDPTTEAAREPDRSRLRETFREFELRDPLRRLEEALGEDAAAAADETQVAARLRAGSPADAARLGDGDAPLAVAVRAPALAEGELFAREQPWAFGVACGGEVVEGEVAVAGRAGRRARRAPGDRPRREGARAPSRRGSPTTRCSPPTCSTRRGAPSRSPSSARSAALRPRSTTAPPPTRCSRRSSRGSSARSSPSAGRRSCSTASSCRSCACCATWRSRASG